MTVSGSCRIAFSFTALFFTGCTFAYAVIRKHGRASRAGHGFITLITIGLTAVCIPSEQSHKPILDRLTNSLLCAAIGASPLIQFETLNEALRPSGVLPLYASRCIMFARVFVVLKIAVIITFLTKPHPSNILLAVFLSEVTLEYVLLTVISFKLYKHRAQQIYLLLVAAVFFVSSILRFCLKDRDMLSWSLWILLLVLSLSQSFLLLAHEIKKHYTRSNTIAEQYHAPEEIQLHPDMLPTNNGLSTSTSTQHLVSRSKQFGRDDGHGMLQDPVWWEIQVSVSQLSSSHGDCEVAQLCEEPEGDSLTSNIRQYNLQESASDVYHDSTNEQQTKYNVWNSENIETQQARLIPREDLENNIRVTTDIRVDYGEIAVCGAGYFTNANGQYKWNLPWSRIGYISHQGTDGTWETKSTSCHWRRWHLGAMV